MASEGSGLRSDVGGSAAASGFNYQHRVTAWFAVRMLVGTRASGVRGLYEGAVLEIACETDDPVDDCRVTLRNSTLALQAKHSLELRTAEDSEIAKTASQFVRQHLMSEHATDKLILVTTSSSSRSVTGNLKRGLDRFRKLPEPSLPSSDARTEQEKSLAKFLDHVRREWARHSRPAAEPTEEKLRSFLKNCWVWTLDVEHGMPEEGRALDLLRSGVLSDPRQADSAWDSILQISAAAAADKTGFDRRMLETELVSRGIRLTDGNAERLNVHPKSIVGQPISRIADPYDLEIHPSISLPDSTSSQPVLTPYIPRDHDDALRQVVATALERSVMAVLVGGSSTGKTRACWEAIRTLPREWRVWHPVNPTRPDALLAALQNDLIAPQTVIWLNEAQYYLDTSPGNLGEQIAASLWDLIRSAERGPVLVLGTMWSKYWDLLAERPLDAKGAHAEARALLESRRIPVPDRFEEQDLSDLSSDVANDPRIMEAVRRQDGRLTQFLAGAFELLNLYELAPPEAAAMITAAVDARRFGQSISGDFLRAAAPGYLDDDSWNGLDDDWFEKGLEYATRKCLGVPGPLTKIRPRPGSQASAPNGYKLSDYLEQIVSDKRRTTIPPQTFWDAAGEFAPTVDDILELAHEVQSRGRFHCAANLYILAAKKGHLEALLDLAHYRKRAKDRPAAEQLLNEAAERGLSRAWLRLADIYEEEGKLEIAEQFLENAGPDIKALERRARLRRKSGDIADFLALLEQAADLGSTDALRELATFLKGIDAEGPHVAELRRRAGESKTDPFVELRRAAQALFRANRQAVTASDNFVKIVSKGDMPIQEIRDLLGPRAENDSTHMIVLGRIEMNRGFLDQARALFSRALDDGASMDDQGGNLALEMTAKIIRKSGERKNAERLLKYGLEIDGTISQSWSVSMNA